MPLEEDVQRPSWQKLIQKDHPEMGPITTKTLIMNLEWGVRRREISPDFAKQRIAELRADKRRSSYNSISRTYQAVVDLVGRFTGKDYS